MSDTEQKKAAAIEELTALIKEDATAGLEVLQRVEALEARVESQWTVLEGGLRINMARMDNAGISRDEKAPKLTDRIEALEARLESLDDQVGTLMREFNKLESKINDG